MGIFQVGFSLISSAQESEEPVLETGAATEAATPSDVVTIHVENGDITKVLNIFSRQTGKSLVIGPEVTGNVTMRLNDIPYPETVWVRLSRGG